VVLVVLVTLAPAVLLTQQVLRVPAVLIRRVALAALRTLVQGRVALVDRQISGQVARVAPAVLPTQQALRVPVDLIQRM
jgi:hypothetical protein